MKRIIFLNWILASLCLGSCQYNQQAALELPGKNDIAISWELVSNVLADQPQCRAAFTITNHGELTLGDVGWVLYYNQSPRKLIKNSISGPANIEEISGDFYRLVPAKEFLLQPGQSITITYDSQDWLIKKVDGPQGLYMVYYDSEGDELGRVPVTDYTIKPFVKPEQTERFKNDKIPVPTPQSNYEKNSQLTRLKEDQLQKVLPTPISEIIKKGSLELNAAFTIHFQKGLEKEANYLAERLQTIFGKKPALTEGTGNDAGIINLKQEAINVAGHTSEAYKLKVDEKAIDITGSDPAGVFYAIQSLMELVPGPAFRGDTQSVKIPMIRVEDAPAFAYRGLHLDVARNFQKKAAVLKLIDLMAQYKLNKLHLHLTDDEGWRLQIEGLPELTDVGAYRGHTLIEDQYLHPSYGSGPEPDPETSYGSGFYTRKDFEEILQYAFARHIEVIPELNMPGHARAAIKAMNARYNRLMDQDKDEEAKAFLLTDFDDDSKYYSAQAYDDNVVCVCRESVYHFYETVVDDVRQMYDEAGVPLTTIHTGGDEVPAGAWEKSPICQDFLQKDPDYDSAAQLQSYFLQRVRDILSERHLKTAGWEEVALNKNKDGRYQPNEDFVGKEVIPYVWNNLGNQEDLGYRLANTGFPVVLCNVTNLYFDLAYNKDPQEPGLYWGGFVDTRKAWSFIPYDIFKSTETDALGNPIDAAVYKNMEQLKPAARSNILGLQGELWGETLKGQSMLEYYVLPKMLGLAERAWAGQASWGNINNADMRETATKQAWNVFANVIGQHEMPRLDYLFGGFNYRLSLPGAEIRDGKLYANIAYPGLTIRYSTDGNDPSPDSPAFESPVEVKGTVKIASFDTRGRSSRVWEVQGE